MFIHNLIQRYSKKGILGIIITSIVLALFLTNNTPPVKAESYNFTLNYLYYYYFFSEGKMDTSGSIYWSFTTSNYVVLEVWVLNDANYDIYATGGQATGYLVSDTVNYFDSGTFSIPYEDKWYILFINSDDTRMSSTSVSVTVTFYGVKGTSNQSLIIGIVVAAVVITAIAVPLSIASKKKKEQMVSQQASINQQSAITGQLTTTYSTVQPIQTETVQSQPIKMKYCGYCGNSNKPESRFCAYCGSDL
ncbi:MAG: zinc ribbon domain-containing protein [Candidatus Heimdallarchaeota archaeon]|nr:zinc ribbon domain-containing protein [Candidatus Heimdallarchaeota archaeon]